MEQNIKDKVTLIREYEQERIRLTSLRTYLFRLKLRMGWNGDKLKNYMMP